MFTEVVSLKRSRHHEISDMHDVSMNALEAAKKLVTIAGKTAPGRMIQNERCFVKADFHENLMLVLQSKSSNDNSKP